METFDVAHIHEQGVDLIIIPLDSAFDRKTSREQQQIIASLQACAARAQLRGAVIPVWESSGYMKFIAPPNWHPFFRSISMDFIYMNINRELSCG